MQDSTSSTAENWTVARIIGWASEDFKKKGVESPRLEAEILLSEVLGIDRVRLIIDAQRPLTHAELDAYRDCIRRRRVGEPVAYILGKKEFFGRDFYVDKRVLIPRPDTEILVEEALRRSAHRNLSGRALDLCTGSGCVAISFALARRTWQVTGTDLSDDALVVARKNAQNWGALWGVRFLRGDLYGALHPEEKFELILANPPYIPKKEIEGLHVSVRDFEPRAALDGGGNGLDFYPRLLDGALQHLIPGGVLAVEVGAGQAPAVADLFAQRGLDDLARATDYGGHERVVSGRAPRRLAGRSQG